MAGGPSTSDFNKPTHGLKVFSFATIYSRRKLRVSQSNATFQEKIYANADCRFARASFERYIQNL